MTTRYPDISFLRSSARSALSAVIGLFAIEPLHPRRLSRHNRGINAELNFGRRDVQLREFGIRKFDFGRIEPSQHAWLVTLDCGSDFGFVVHFSP